MNIFLRVFFILGMFVNWGYANQNDTTFSYIIDTDIGGDIDDVLALLVALDSGHPPIAITTNHIEPEEKARIAKLILTEQGFPNIPVYAGVGVKRNEPNNIFLQQNSLWPPLFGYPNPQDGENEWYIKQALAYKEEYPVAFDNIAIEKESAPAFIARVAKDYSPQNKLVIIALGPLHNLKAALSLDSSIKKNIKLYSMGGNYPKGYNWLISPETTARVISEIDTIVISSEFIEANQFYITPNELDDMEKQIQSRLGRTILSDWKNWHKVDKTYKKNTYLSDPITVYMALHPDEVSHVSFQHVVFPCLDNRGELKSEFRGLWYFFPGLENQLIQLSDKRNSTVGFAAHATQANFIRNSIVNSIVMVLS